MADMVSQVIAFDNGEMESVSEFLEFAKALVDSGLVNSTGSYQRFVGDLVRAGYILPDGTMTEHGKAVAEFDEEN